MTAYRIDHVRKDSMKDFLFTLLAWLLALPLIIGAIVFAVYNPDPVSIVVNPFSDAANIPVYIPVFTAIAFGFLLGCLMTWAAMARQRHELRELKRRIKALEKEISLTSRTPVPAQEENPTNYPIAKNL